MNQTMQRLRRRIKRKLNIFTRDVSSEIGWHIGGGKLVFERYHREIRDSHRWCFIVGVNNSGTSLLQRILEETGQVSTLPHEGQLYTRVLPRGARRGHERVFSEIASELIMEPTDSVGKAPRLVFDWMRHLDLPIKELIVEKTTVNALRMRWLQRVFPNCRFICMVRNGFAVCEGIRRKGKKSVERGARHWNFVNQKMISEATGVNHSLFIKYEDLVDRGSTVSRDLSEFLAIEKKEIENALQKKYLFRAAGQPQPVANMNPASFEKLTQSDIQKIHDIASTMLQHYGYDSRL